MGHTLRTFIVSFGDSDRYRLDYQEPTDENRHNSRPFEKIEQELNDYLSARFPSETSLAYFTTPKVSELSNPSDAEGYPPLDDKAIEEIKRVLAKEIEEKEATDVLNSDALFSDI